MNLSNGISLKQVFPVTALAAALIALIGCTPMDQVRKPTLREVRLGNAQGTVIEDTALLPGEIAGEVTEIDRARRDVIVRTDDGRRDVLRYDIDRTRVRYHGFEYGIESLESGDRIAYRSPTRDRYIETIRIQEPVQARSGTTVARPRAPASRTEVIEGTVERVDPSLGVFDVRPRAGRTVTVSVPYNARSADVDDFRSLRRGDLVRVEGEFVSPDNLQLLSFLSVRDR